MRRRTTVISVLLGVICLLLWWHWSSPEKEVRSESPVTVFTNAPSVAETPQQEPQVPQSAASVRSAPASPDPQTMDSNTFYQWWSAQGQAPIDFYGKVIDENSNVIAGANVSFGWDENRTARSYKTYKTVSASDGLFSLNGARGGILEVAVSKEGYYTPRPGFESFQYGVGVHFSSDSFNPVVFKLKKKGTPEPLIAVKRNYPIPRDGTPVAINVASGATAGQDENVVAVLDK